MADAYPRPCFDGSYVTWDELAADPLPGEFITTTGPPRLVLITCAGPYHQGSGYRDRLYVDAGPAPPSSGEQAPRS